ncbi:hypothetical protein BIW11_07556 [Tropilaelaps mercedesae]|uniref:Uncharacterized protein n=1 Tax=Tropilaelaps mercedesae TaxID=418985 RepID=A0A1V9XTF9_9ACAR|nr:hypothetical protein BIW11_07556 [Tropilaelaps mercedesae]
MRRKKCPRVNSDLIVRIYGIFPVRFLAVDASGASVEMLSRRV